MNGTRGLEHLRLEDGGAEDGFMLRMKDVDLDMDAKDGEYCVRLREGIWNVLS